MAAFDRDGQNLDVSWTRGAGKIDWADTAAGEGDAAMFADAPFVVGNETAHACARRRSGRYSRCKVTANLAIQR